MGTRRTKALLGVGIPVLVVALIVGAWAIDTRGASGTVPRNVRLAGHDVGRMTEAKVAAIVRDIGKQYASTEVEVSTPQGTYKVPAGRLGLTLDEKATVQNALDIGQHDNVAMRPIEWLGSFLEHRKAALKFDIRRDTLTAGLASLQGPGRSQPKEPSIVPINNGVGIIPGSTGVSIDPETVATALLARASSGELPIVVQAKAVVRRPQVSNAQAQRVANNLTVDTAKPLGVKAGSQLVSFEPVTQRSWLTSTVGNNGLQVTLDRAKITADLKAALTQVTQARNASFQVNGPTVTIVPSQDGTRCCAADSGSRLLKAIRAKAGSTEIGLLVDKPTFTTAAARKLGIKEPVGTTTEWKGIPQVKSFTTYHPGGAPESPTSIAWQTRCAGRSSSRVRRSPSISASDSARGRRATSKHPRSRTASTCRASEVACRSSRPRCSTPRSSPGSTSSSIRRIRCTSHAIRMDAKRHSDGRCRTRRSRTTRPTASSSGRATRGRASP